MGETVEDLLGPEQTVDDLLGPEAPPYVPKETTPASGLERAAQDFESNRQFRQTTGSNITGTQGAPADFDKPLVHVVPELTDEELAGLREASPGSQKEGAAANQVAKSINSLTSLNNLSRLVATMGLGAVPALGRAVALGFAGWMAKNAVGSGVELAKELQKPEEDRDNEKIGALMADAGVNTFMASLSGWGGLHGDKLTPAEQVAKRINREVGRADLGPVEDLAAKGGTPTVEELLGPEKEVQTSERPPKASVPETPAEEYQTGVEEIRAKGARTTRQIQELWPKAGLSREQARVWRDRAWPKPPNGGDTRESGTLPGEGERQTQTDLVEESPPAAPSPNESEVTNAKQIEPTTQPDGDVLYTEGQGSGTREVPAAEGSAGVPPRGPGEAIPAPAPGAPQADVPSVESPEDLQAQLQQELTSETVHSMATGAAPPLRTSPPLAPRPLAPPPPVKLVPSAPLPAPKVGSLRARLQAMRTGLQSYVSPQNIDASAKAFSHILRENNAQAALDLVRADAHLGEMRATFDQTPVPKDYVYDPAQPMPFNYAVMDAFERNRAALPPELQGFAKAFDDEFAWRVAEVRKLKPGALQSLIANYFPHMWERERDPNTKAVMQEVAAKAPFHGSGAFMKERTVPFFADGIARGLRPISDNPVDLLLAKLHQMDKFLMAAKTMEEAKGNGMAKYYPLGRKIPAGRTVVDDPAFTVYAPPLLEVKEAFDVGIRRGLVDFMQKMGFRHERVAKLGVNEWGQYTTGRGEIKSRFGGPDFVIMHEIGHGLEERYGLSRYLLSNAPLRQEMANLADLRAQYGGSKKFRKYIQTPDEQVANAVHAYIYAPDAMAKVAPNAQMVLRNIIRAHPELQDLEDIKPGLALGVDKMEVPTLGPQLAGHWTLPNGAAAVLTNYLSPGLSKWAPYRTVRAASNILNAAQLGLSGFHVGFTSLDAVVSSVATGLGYLVRSGDAVLHGDARRAGSELKKGVQNLAFAPVAPMGNYYLGKAVQTKMVDPTATHVEVGLPRLGLGSRVRLSPAADALVSQVAQLAVKGGLRAETDPFWKTAITRNLVRSWNEGGVKNYAKVGLQAPFALIEQSMRPIAEYLVPRQKLGVFTQLALQELDRIGPGASNEETRAAMARAADWTEDRMGQMTYDNLFYNKVVKDASLLGFRAYGWQLGKYRHLYGVGADAATLAKGLAGKATAAATGRPFAGAPLEITNRMLYPVALTVVAATVGAVLHRMLTGRNPETLLDYLFPQNGQLEKDGKPQRLALPTYVKDLVSDWKDFPDYQKMGLSFYHKLNPYIAAAVDMWNNKDYYGVEIRHPDDPAVKQAADLGKFALKQFTPFSISGTMKLAEDQSPIAQLVFPFVGVVPAKKALTMTPAETLAADITRASLPVGARTREAFDHSQVLKSIVQDLRKNGDQGAQLANALAAGQLRPGDAKTVVSMLTTTPLQYQVGKMSPQDGMRVWRLASQQEREQISLKLLHHVTTSKVLDAETRSAYLQELVRDGLGAGPGG
jgi:hypothetical protein